MMNYAKFCFEIGVAIIATVFVLGVLALGFLILGNLLGGLV